MVYQKAIGIDRTDCAIPIGQLWHSSGWGLIPSIVLSFHLAYSFPHCFLFGLILFELPSS